MANTEAEKQTSGEQDSPGSDSAPENKEVPESGQEGNSPVESSQPSGGLKRDIFKLREERRQLRSENEDLKSELSQIRSLLEKQSKEDKQDQEISSLEELEKRVFERLAATEKAKELESKKARANEMFSRHPLVQGDEVFGMAVQELMHSKYGHLIDIDPQVALDQALRDVCYAKGVDYEPVDISPSRASGVPGSSGTAGKTPKEASAEAYAALRKKYDVRDPEQRAAYKAELKALESSGK